MQDHLTAHELSRQALEFSENAHRQSQVAIAGHHAQLTRHQAVAAIAHEIWESRGRREGAATEDWLRAEEKLGHPTRS
jgi:hypothetical protein